MPRLVIVVVAFALAGCAGSMTVIPRAGGLPLAASYEDAMGQTTVTLTLADGESLRGTLIWIPPGSSVSSAVVTTGQSVAFGGGITSGNKGMYVGAIVGNRGTTMRIELVCNTFTGRCVGAGQSSAGAIYDIQR